MTSVDRTVGRRSPLRGQAALITFSCLAGFMALYVVSDHTARGQRADDLAFLVIYSLVPGGWPVHAAAFLARDVVIVVLAAAVALLGGAALLRWRWRPIVRSCVTVAGSVLTTPYLRDEVLTRHPFIPETFPLNSMPSTHASAAAALVVAVVLLWPSGRPWWLLNASGVILGLVALGNVVGQAHRPSDVAGSYLFVAGLLSASYLITGVRFVNRDRHP
jgi:hypothetical protein